MPQVTPLGLLRPFFTDKCGKLLVGGKVFTYEANSLTPKITYADSDGLMPNTNPVILDKSGEADIYLDGNYRFQIFNRFGVLIHDINNIRDHFKDQIQNFFTGNILAAGGLPENSVADYNYLMQRLAQIAVDRGWSADFVVTADDSTQQQVNDRVGNTWYKKPLGYRMNDRVMLNNGDIVKSTVSNNITNPNVDMTGWKFDNNTVESIAELLTISNPKNGQRIYVKSYYAGLNKGGGYFVYDGSNGWVREFGGEINWYDWGIKDNQSYTAEEYFAPLLWGFENGYNTFNLAKGITITSACELVLNSDEPRKIVINAWDTHSFNYQFSGQTTSILLYGGANVQLDIKMRIECSKMGAYLNQAKLVRPLFISGFSHVNGWLEFNDVYGYGLFCDSPSLELHHYVAKDCWGNNVIKGTPSFDAYGDGLYLSCLKSVVHNPVIINTKSISRAGIVIEALVADKLCNSTIHNPTISGYDRGVHAESMQNNTSLDVKINGGAITECNTQVLLFSLNAANVNVTLNNVSQSTAQAPNPTIPHDFPAGHFMVSGVGSNLETNNCTFKKHIASSQIIGNASYKSNNDTWSKDSKLFIPAWCQSLIANNLDASKCTDTLNLAYFIPNVQIDMVRTSGSVTVDYLEFGSTLSNFNFIAGNAGSCGILTIKSQIKGCAFVNFTFRNTPANWYAIDNQWDRAVGVQQDSLNNPLIDNVQVYGGTFVKNTGIDFLHNYRSTVPSYVFLDETTTKYFRAT